MAGVWLRSGACKCRSAEAGRGDGGERIETGAWQVADGITAIRVAYVREGAGQALIGASQPTRQLPGSRRDGWLRRSGSS